MDGLLQGGKNMDELVKLVAAKTGLSEEMATTAVQTVLDFLKQRLPAPIAERLEDLLGDEEGQLDLGDLAAGLGSLLGR
jgi:uncharacterized protein (DUF2267 family)